MALPVAPSQITHSDIMAEFGATANAEWKISADGAAYINFTPSTIIKESDFYGASAGPAASTDFTWTNQPALAGTYSQVLQSVVHDGNQYVVVSISGAATSPDGITWTAQTGLKSAMGNKEPTVIHWNGSQFLVMGGIGFAGSEAATSPDAITWTDRSAGITSAIGKRIIENVAWNGSIYCAVGRGGMVCTSPDGVTWTDQSSNYISTSNVFGIVWDGSLFWATGIGNHLASSPDGVNWTSHTGLADAYTAANTTGGGAYTIEWTGSQYIVGGHYGNVATSPDGITWTPRTDYYDQVKAADGTGSFDIYKILWNGSQLLAVGSGIGGNRAFSTAISTDGGVTWVFQTMPTEWKATGIRVLGAAWNGVDQYLVVGDQGGFSNKDINATGTYT